jgi:hypothetical protein
MLYENIDYVEGLDEAVINRYCLMTAEMDEIERLLIRMNAAVDKCEKPGEMVSLYKSIASAEITKARLADRLLQIEDRLYLNPVSRMRNIPKKEKEKPQSDFDKKFGNV